MVLLSEYKSNPDKSLPEYDKPVFSKLNSAPSVAAAIPLKAGTDNTETFPLAARRESAEIEVLISPPYASIFVPIIFPPLSEPVFRTIVFALKLSPNVKSPSTFRVPLNAEPHTIPAEALTILVAAYVAKSRVPPVKDTGPAPSPMIWPKTTLPASMTVPPVYVFAVARVNVPSPFFVRAIFPLRQPVPMNE